MQIRFCPELHTLEGLSTDQVVEAVVAGFRSQTRVLGGLILVMLRSGDTPHCAPASDK